MGYFRKMRYNQQSDPPPTHTHTCTYEPISWNPGSAPDRQVQGLTLSSEAYCGHLLGYLYLLLKGGGTLLFLVRYLWGSFADGIKDCKTK